MDDQIEQPKRLPGMNRRGFVSAAAVGVGAAWVAPGVISLPANGTRALVNSPPPKSTTTTTTKPDDGNLNNNEDQNFDDPKTAAAAVESSNLPKTGMDLQDPLTAAFGLIAAGGALQVWSAQRERLVAATIPADDAGATTEPA